MPSLISTRRGLTGLMIGWAATSLVAGCSFLFPPRLEDLQFVSVRGLDWKDAHPLVLNRGYGSGYTDDIKMLELIFTTSADLFELAASHGYLVHARFYGCADEGRQPPKYPAPGIDTMPNIYYKETIVESLTVDRYAVRPTLTEKSRPFQYRAYTAVKRDLSGPYPELAAWKPHDLTRYEGEVCFTTGGESMIGQQFYANSFTIPREQLRAAVNAK